MGVVSFLSQARHHALAYQGLKSLETHALPAKRVNSNPCLETEHVSIVVRIITHYKARLRAFHVEIFQFLAQVRFLVHVKLVTTLTEQYAPLAPRIQLNRFPEMIRVLLVAPIPLPTEPLAFA